MSWKNDLRTIQSLFWDLIAAPEGVEKGALQMKEDGRLETTDLSFLVRGDERLGPAARLDIYASMYFYRLRDGLAGDFSKVAEVVGGARFHNLITDYLLEHPSRFRTLLYVGRALPGFIAKHPLNDGFPFLADLARLEWARIETFDEADAEPVTRERIAGLSPETIESQRLRLVPACRLLELDWSVAPLWRALEEQGSRFDLGGGSTEAAVASGGFEEISPADIEPPKKEKTWIRAWRQNMAIYHLTMWSDEHACLVRLRDKGTTLPELGELILKHMLADDPTSATDLQPEAAKRMAAMVELWLSEGLLVEEGG